MSVHISPDKVTAQIFYEDMEDTRTGVNLCHVIVIYDFHGNCLTAQHDGSYIWLRIKG